jgi:hypothetical protein
MRRVQSAQEFTGCSRFQPICYDYDRRHQYRVPSPVPPV